jgi:hypothetical protein
LPTRNVLFETYENIELVWFREAAPSFVPWAARRKLQRIKRILTLAIIQIACLTFTDCSQAREVAEPLRKHLCDQQPGRFVQGVADIGISSDPTH